MGTPAPPMTAWGKAQFDANKPSYGPRAVPPAIGNDPLGHCDPQGYPRVFFYGLREFFQVPGRVLQVFEWNRVFREVWTDGSALPEDPDPRWYGWAVTDGINARAPARTARLTKNANPRRNSTLASTSAPLEKAIDSIPELYGGSGHGDPTRRPRDGARDKN